MIMAGLNPLQKEVLNLFSENPLKEQFYWTGGTALSVLYLNHRRSEDIDFFSDQTFSHDQIVGFVQDLKSQLGLERVEEEKIFDRWEFFLQDDNELRIEFVFYNHPNLKPRQEWKGITVDSLEDIAVNKTMALFGRNDPKDVVDLYFLLTEKEYGVEKLLEKVERKFGVKFNKTSFWSEGCRVLEDLDDITPLLLAESSERKQQIIEEIKKYFSSKSSDYLDEKLK